MDKTAHIYIYGDIVNIQGDDASFWGCVSLTTVKNAVEANPDAEEFIVHIHSCGGDCFEGFAIYDYLVNTGKTITTIVEGLCASIATVIFLAGSVRQLTENSRFLIHNPSVWTEGTAEEIAQVLTLIQAEQDKILNFYVEKTGTDAATLQALMNEDIIINPDKALELKFATQIIETVVAMVAHQNAKHKNLILNSIKLHSKNKKMKAEKKTKFQGLVATFSAFKNEFKAVTEDAAATVNSVTLDDNTVIYFAEDAIAEGIEVFTDEALSVPVEDGDYTEQDGDTMTIKDGKVSAITPAASGETSEQTIARLTTELAAATASASENETIANTMADSLEHANTLLASVKSSGWKPQARQVTPAKPGVIAKKGADAPEASLKEKVAAEKAARKAAQNK